MIASSFISCSVEPSNAQRPVLRITAWSAAATPEVKLRVVARLIPTRSGVSAVPVIGKAAVLLMVVFASCVSDGGMTGEIP